MIMAQFALLRFSASFQPVGRLTCIHHAGLAQETTASDTLMTKDTVTRGR